VGPLRGGDASGGYLDEPGGTIFLSGARMDLYVSPDRGRSWRESPSLRPAAGLAAAACLLGYQ
jgi:hypothetical protein